MASATLGIGDLAVESGRDGFIHTMALGSCLAVTLYDFASRSAAMAHVALPDSALSPDKARALPGYFADTAVATLLSLLREIAGRGNRIKPIVKVVGGASLVDPGGSFNIGVRNLAAVKQALESHGLGIYLADVGGNFSRNVSVEAYSGHVRIWSPGIGSWSL